LACNRSLDAYVVVGLPTRTGSQVQLALVRDEAKQADTYDRRRKDPPRLENASLIEDWRGKVEEKARDGLLSLCASRMR